MHTQQRAAEGICRLTHSQFQRIKVVQQHDSIAACLADGLTPANTTGSMEVVRTDRHGRNGRNREITTSANPALPQTLTVDDLCVARRVSPDPIPNLIKPRSVDRLR